MKIRKIIASDFGCLSGSYRLFDDRANVIVEANERGKSTLVSAILAALYGFPPSRERKTLPEKEAYQPWKGRSYRVGLEVEDDDGRPLMIERDFDEDKVKVTDLSTNKDVTEEFRAGKKDFAVGERLLSISREVLVKTCLVRQLEIQDVGESSDLVSKVQQIFDTSGGKGTAAKAISALDEALRKFSGTQLKGTGLVETEISRLEEAIERGEVHMQELIAAREKVSPSMARLTGLRKRLEQLETNRRRLEYLSRKAEMAEIESELKSDAANRGKLDELIEKKKSLEPYKGFPGEEARKLPEDAGRLDEVEKQRRQLEESLQALKDDLGNVKAKLKAYEGLEGLNEDFRTHLHDLWIELARLGQEVEKKQERLRKSKEKFQKEGYDLSEIDELFRRFSNLSAKEKDSLRDSEKKIPEIKAEVLEFEKAEETCREELRAMRKPRGVLGVLGGAFFLAGIVAISLSAVALGVAGLGMGVAALVFGLLLLPRLTMHKTQRLIGEQEGARERRESLLAERDELARKMKGMAEKTGFETTAELTDAFKRWGRLYDRKWQLDAEREEVEAAEKNESSAKEGISRDLKRLGLDVAPKEVDLTILADAEKKVREFLELSSCSSEMEQGCRKVETEIQRLQGEEGRLGESIRRVLARSNLPLDLPLDEALPKVEEARKNAEEYQRVVKIWIPDAQQRVLPSEKLSAMTQRAEVLWREIGKMRAEEANLAGLKPTKSHSEYEEEARTIAREIANNTDERARISREVQNVEDNYRKEYPRLANEVAELTEALGKTQRFQQSMSLAIETLQKISARSHAVWAGALNPRANEILARLNPRCRELKFDRDLSFTVVPVEGEQPKDQMHIDAQESIGARHQIYLAVRLALADYLSSAGKELPVILDDPFATSDDDRFVSGMTFVCREFRKDHQTIILTCHRQRHLDLFRQRAPDAAQEIRVVELTPSTS